MSPRGGPPPPESPCLLVFWTLHSGWRQSAVAMALKLCTCLAPAPSRGLDLEGAESQQRLRQQPLTAAVPRPPALPGGQSVSHTWLCSSYKERLLQWRHDSGGTFNFRGLGH